MRAVKDPEHAKWIHAYILDAIRRANKETGQSVTCDHGSKSGAWCKSSMRHMNELTIAAGFRAPKEVFAPAVRNSWPMDD